MCFTIDRNVKSLTKRVVWKVFDKPMWRSGKILSLYQASAYPKGKLVERSEGISAHFSGNDLQAHHGLYFFTSKAKAAKVASRWENAYIAKFAVSPEDFLFMSVTGGEVTYNRATRVGNFIRIKQAD